MQVANPDIFIRNSGQFYVRMRIMELMTIDLPEHDVLRRPAQPVSFPLNEEIKQLIAQMRQFIERLASPYGKPAGEV